jgi:hypothetical protein
MILAEYLSGAYPIHYVPIVSPRLLHFEPVDFAELEWKIVDKDVPNLIIILSDDFVASLRLHCCEVVPVRILNKGIHLEGAHPGEKTFHFFFQRHELLFLELILF